MNEDSENRNDYGDQFQQKSKYIRGSLPRHSLDQSIQPKTYKSYENVTSRIALPKPEFPNRADFWNVLIRRVSTRTFKREPVEQNELSCLLFGMSGLTRTYPNYAFRATPSAGGLYPIEIYPVINNVKGITRGIYHYDILHHELACLKEGDFRNEVMEGCIGQKMTYKSAINFIGLYFFYFIPFIFQNKKCGPLAPTFPKCQILVRKPVAIEREIQKARSSGLIVIKLARAG